MLPLPMSAYRRIGLPLSAALCLLLPMHVSGQVGVTGWSGYSRDPQHTSLSPVMAQRMRTIRWQTKVDENPQYSGDDLLIHYGSPVITKNNTILIPVKTGVSDGFKVEGRNANNGNLIWSMPTDYSLPPHGWTPPCSLALTPDNRLILPGSGGTVYYRTNPDSAGGTVTQVAFYGLDTYSGDKATYDANVKISTPFTCDSDGNVFFGFIVTGSNGANLTSGLARIGADGKGSWASASAIAGGDSSIQKVVYNCAPAISPNGKTLYVAVNDNAGSGFGRGYLCAVNTTTLESLGRVRLKDPRNTDQDSLLPDDGTATPTVGPDGDVYFGVLESPFYSNHLRGWLLHFRADLKSAKTPGAFGWDDTASVVPASAVPSYKGTSAYLLMTKYNNYVQGGGDGVNKVAVVDPFDVMADSITGTTVMKEILVMPGPTPDLGFRSSHPNAVREWCVNSCAIDPIGKCAVVNNEDGKVYRWDFTTNTLTETVTLTSGIGEAYTPTLIGPDGTVYAINNATLFAIGLERPYKTIVRAGNSSANTQGTVWLRAQLRRSDGLPLQDKTFSFSINGRTVGSAKTDATGTAYLLVNLWVALGAGNYPILATFAGDTDYAASNASSVLTLRDRTSMFVPAVTSRANRTIYLRGLLRRYLNSARLAGKTLTFQVNGVTVGTAVTGADGTATLAWVLSAGTPVGTQTITVSFAGDTGYSPITGTGVLTITP